MLNIPSSLKSIFFNIYVFAFSLFAFGQTNIDYRKLVDSADVYIDGSSEKALSFLEAIPKPFENHISGRIADYYSLRALIHDEFNEYAKYHQCSILAIKYAEKEKNYCIAGEACIGLFSNLYYIEKDTTAFKYLEMARSYYKKCDYEYGAIDVEQVEAYAMFLDGDYTACNNLLLNNLDTYKSINDDAYYYMFALYMLTSNYIYLNDFENVYKYFELFKDLKDNPSIVKFNYFSFEAGINMCFSDIYYDQRQIDSTQSYLQKSTSLTDYMSEDVLKDYYRLHADVNKYLGKIDESKVYIDSLLMFQNLLHDKTIEASFEVNDSLVEAETELLKQNKNDTFKTELAGFIIISLLLLSVFSYYFYRKQKNKLEFDNNQTSDSLSYLQTNNEQLAIKVYGLEEYIKNLKKEVKKISIIDSIENQKARIKDLYKNLHINSSTLLDKSENHLEIVNELNIEFFKKIEERYPQLKKSEIIVCYYLFMGFTNKEIAVFLNTTVRSVESRRYRISKKINLVKKEGTLLEHLQNTFSGTLVSK